jgi:uncharacterized repeat protein (TIGR01451 family)
VRAGLLVLIVSFLVGASVGRQPFADAQPAPGPPALTLKVVTEGAAGGPFRLALTRDRLPEATPTEVTATTASEGDPVDVTGLPRTLASDTYHLGVVKGSLPEEPAGGTWAWSGLACDGQDVGISLETGEAALVLASGDTPTCVTTMTWTPDPATAAARAEAQAPDASDPDSGETTTTAVPDTTTTTDLPTTTTGTTTPPPARALAADEDPPVVIQADDTHATLTISKAGGRSGPQPTQLTPLAGATMGVYATRADANNRTNPVATCVTAAPSGTCSVDVAASSSRRTYYVREVSPPAGFFRIDNVVHGPYYAPALETYVEPVEVTRNNTYAVPAVQEIDGTLGTIPRKFANPLNNPVTPDRCGLNVAFIVDTSSSVSSTEMTQLKNAARTAVNGLVGTPTNVATFSFDTKTPGTGARPNITTPVSVLNGATPIITWINGLPQDTGTFNLTNWDRGIAQVAEAATKFDLAIMLTDGNPTVWGPNGDREQSTVTSSRSATEQAVASANSLKAEGTHIIGVGIGVDELFPDSIASISGPDDVVITDFDELAEELRELATAGCQGSVTVVKETRTSTTGPFTPTLGWTISTSTAGVTPASAVTGADGATNFGVDFGTTPVAKAVTFVETQQAGYTLVQQSGFNARCTQNVNGTSSPLTVTNAPLGFTATIQPTGIVSCAIQNQKATTPRLTLVKQVVNNDGGTAAATAWTLRADNGAGTLLSGATGTAAVTDVTVPAGTYTLSESGPGGYAASAWACTGGGTLTGSQITLAGSDVTTCTITNDDLPARLTLVKQVNNQFGGTAVPTDWTLLATGPTSIQGVSGSAAVTNAPVSAGHYVLNEVGGPPGYADSAWSCTSTLRGGPLRSTGGVDLLVGEARTCTIVNSDSPARLTLVKQVVNDDGGSAQPTAWTLTGDGPTLVQGVTGSVNVTNRTVQAGTYVLSEAGPPGYTASAWTCTGTGTQAGAQVTLAAGQTATCTIVNDDDAAHLTLVKQVNNQFGGTATPADWTLNAFGTTTVSGVSGTPAVTDVPVLPGNYGLTETGPAGYSNNGFTCTGATQFDPNNIAIAIGQDVTCTIVNSDAPATLTLAKQVRNDSGGTATETDWTLAAAGPTPITGVHGSAAVTGVLVNPGTYDLSEADGPPGYVPSIWSCNGGTMGGPAQVTLAPGQDVTCTITNDDAQAHLTLVKEVVNDDGGTAGVGDWTLQAAGPTTEFSGASGTAAVTAVPVEPGFWSLAETDGPTGYTASDWACTSTGLGQPLGDLVSIALGENVTCTIVNDDDPALLTLVKEVTNDNGGTAVVTDWTLTATGPTAGVTGPTGDPAVTDAPVVAGTYTLTESGPAGYEASSWSCVGGSLTGAQVTLAVGESATCTIENDDIGAELTLVKQVVNDDGGTAVASAWTLEAASGGTTVLSGGTGTASVTAVEVDPGSYTLSETGGPAGYGASAWDCTGGTQTGGDTLDLAAGDSAICTITNDDIAPRLTLVKEVVNDDGGTAVPADWTLLAIGPVSISGTTGSPEVTDVPVEAGIYLLDEVTAVSGYRSLGWVCDDGSVQRGPAVALALDEDVTCTVVNDDVPPGLTLVKEVINDDGGTATETDWTLSADGPTPGITGPSGDPAVTEVVVAPGDYDLSESGGPDGYTASEWVCSGATAQTGSTVTIDVGQSVVCGIVNDDVAPVLTLVKQVVNDDGGTAAAEDWTLAADGPTPGVEGPTGGVAVTDAPVAPGVYDLSESGGPPGYTASAWSCTGGTQDGSSVTLAVGDSATCTITNDDQAAHLTLVKTVTNDHGGTAAATDWTLTAAGPTAGVSGPTGDPAVTDAAVDAGSYALSESAGPAGYTPSAWSCVGGAQAGAAVTLALGESATCTITNDDQPAHLTLVKQVVNDNGGTSVVGDWVIEALGPTPGVIGITGDPAITDATVAAGSYDLSESDGAPGYLASDWVCEGGTQVDADTVSLALGDTATCTITNDDIPALLTLVKAVVNDDGGTAEPEEWTLSADGPTAGVTGPTGDPAVTAAAVDAGAYALSESGGPAGYTASDWLCSGGTQDGSQVTLAVGDVATCVITNDDQPSHLTLVKHVVNDNGGQALPEAWTLAADGPTTGISGPTGDPAVTDVQVVPGDYALSESDGAFGYTASAWICMGGSVTAGGTVTVAQGAAVRCSITNDDQPASLTLVKQVVNDDGGTAIPTDWTLAADGPTGGITGATGDAGVTDVLVFPGTYHLSETGPPGYSALAGWDCVGGILQTERSVTVRLGQSVTCTITNDDVAPTLTLVKQVVNDDGGTAVATDWTLTASGPTPGVSGPTGDPAVTEAPVAPGAYDLSEAGPNSYAASAWSCEGGSLTGSTVTLAVGDHATCTIVNDDEAATLTLVKQVVNDDGGTAVATDWTLTADGPTTPISGPTGDAAVTSVPVQPGDYDLSESGGPAGYTASTWACDGGSLTGATVTIVQGDVVTCTITNDDRAASLTLVKQVVNDDGGTAAATDWTLTATGPTPGVSGPTGAPAVTAAVVDAGAYDLSETGPPGYTASAWLCVGGTQAGATLTLGPGESATCTITNDDVPATLTLVKEVVNDDGGTAPGEDWTLAADGPTPISGPTGDPAVTGAAVDAGAYELSESGPAGYTASDWVCVGGSLAGATVTLTPGQAATCTITNDDQPASLTLVKVVVNDDGGPAVAEDWTLTATGPTAGVSGPTGDPAVTAAVVDAGDYDLSESGGPPGYAASAWSCEGGSLAESTVTLGPGESATCTITNDDVPATLTLVKEVVNDDGGTAAATDWTLTADGPTPVSGPTGDPAVTAAPVSAGSYDLSESGPLGYLASAWICVGGTLDDSTLTLALGESATCTITNDDQPAHLTLVKDVVNDQGGTAAATDWTLMADGPTTGVTGSTGDPAVTNAPVEAGSYDLSEDGPVGYTASDWSCVGGTLDGSTVTLALGESATCAITNDDNEATLTLVKEVVNDDGGTAAESQWTLAADGPTPIEGATGDASVTAAPVDAGSYDLSESGGPAGYTASDWVCQGGTLDGATLTLTAGQVATCTITNDDQPATLTLVKQVVNDNTGTAAPEDWTLAADGPTAGVTGPTGDPAVTGATVDAGAYDLSESGGPAGYTASEWACEGGTLDGARLTLTPGQSATCTITNDDVPPTLTIVKSADAAQIVPGGTVDYGITVSNTSTAVARDVVVTDPLPAGLTFVSSDDRRCTSTDGRNVTCALGDLAPGDEVTVTIVTAAADPFPADDIQPDGTVPNTAAVTSPGSDCGPAAAGVRGRAAAVAPQAASDCESTVVVPVQPTIEVDKSSSSPMIVPGQEVPYVIDVSNAGPVVAHDVVAVDRLPNGLTFVSSDWACTADATRRVVTCPVGDLEVGQLVTINITTRAADPFPADGEVDGMVVNDVTITGSSSNCDGGTTDDARCFAAAALPRMQVPAPAPSAGLPRTGAGIATTVASGLAALAAGLVLRATARRRRATAG